MGLTETTTNIPLLGRRRITYDTGSVLLGILLELLGILGSQGTLQRVLPMRHSQETEHFYLPL